MKTNIIEPPQALALRTEALKLEFRQALARLSSSTTTIRRVANALLDAGATRRDLVEWAVEWGYQRQSVRSLLSNLLCRRGLRQRKLGAGRKRNPASVALLAALRAHFGHGGALRLIRATRRLAEAEAPSHRPAVIGFRSFVPLMCNSEGQISELPPYDALILTSQLAEDPVLDPSRQ